MKLPIKINLEDSFFLTEEKCGYQVTKEAKLLWAVILDLMVEFGRVCKQYDIKYSLDCGSLLGAIRHGGFIPWDNDADVIMLRSEYERLCKIASKAFEHPYFFQINETDPGFGRRHAQLRNSLTTCILMDETKDGVPCYGFNQGIFLDVFILDEVPDDAEEMVCFREKLEHQLVQLWDFKQYYWASGASPWIKEAQKEAYDEFESIASSYNGTGQKKVANITLKPQCPTTAFFPKEIYEDLTDYTFEGFSFSGPRDYEIILKGYYGDWHKFVIGNDAHGSMIINAFSPYTEYVKRISEHKIDEEHPILHLYRDRYMLLVQRDVAWRDITHCREQIQQQTLQINKQALQLEQKFSELERYKQKVEELLHNLHRETDLLTNERNTTIRLRRKKKKLEIATFIFAILALLFLSLLLMV